MTGLRAQRPVEDPYKNAKESARDLEEIVARAAQHRPPQTTASVSGQSQALPAARRDLPEMLNDLVTKMSITLAEAADAPPQTSLITTAPTGILRKYELWDEVTLVEEPTLTALSRAERTIWSLLAFVSAAVGILAGGGLFAESFPMPPVLSLYVLSALAVIGLSIWIWARSLDRRFG